MLNVENNVEIKNLFISLENTMRYLPEGINRKVFFNIESLIKKDIALKNEIFIEINLCTKENEYLLIKRKAQFHNKRVVFENYHEDPTVEIGDYFCFAMAVERETIKDLMREHNLQEKDVLHIGGKAFFMENENRKEFVKLKLDNIPWREIWGNDLFTEFIGDYQIKVNEDCELTLHKTNDKGVYSEESKDLKAGEVLDFQKYLEDYVYLGIQFSRNDIYPEIEEKYIVKGQKGMYESNILVVKDELYYSNIVFHEKFLKKLTPLSNFTEINSIKDLLGYYKEDILRIKFFEMSYQYLEDNYKNKKIYTQSRIFSTNRNSKFYHIDNKVCEKCSVKNICIQNIPSNLSEQLSKKVIYLENEEECDFNQIFKENKIIKSASFD